MSAHLFPLVTSKHFADAIRHGRAYKNPVSMQIKIAISNRAHELAVKRGAGTLTPAEDAELRAIWAADRAREPVLDAESQERFDRQTGNG